MYSNPKKKIDVRPSPLGKKKTLPLTFRHLFLGVVTNPIGSMYGRLMLTLGFFVDGKCYHDHGIHTDPSWELDGLIELESGPGRSCR